MAWNRALRSRSWVWLCFLARERWLPAFDPRSKRRRRVRSRYSRRTSLEAPGSLASVFPAGRFSLEPEPDPSALGVFCDDEVSRRSGIQAAILVECFASWNQEQARDV